MPRTTSPTPGQLRRTKRSRLAATLGFIVAVAFPLLVAAPAHADATPTPDPVKQLVGAVTGTVDTATQPVVPRPDPKPDAQSGPTTSHASSSTAGVTNHEHPVAEVSGNHVGSSPSGKPKAKATLLGVAGTTVVGSEPRR